MRFAKKATLTLAGLLLLFALAFGIAACGAAEEEEPDEVAATEDTMEAEDESMAAEETMDETDESMTSEDTMDETDESMAETTEDTTFEAVEDDTGVYIAKPVVGEIFITSASEINEDNIFKARGLSVWTDDPPNKDSILRLRGTDYPSWDSDKRGTPTAPQRLMDDTLVRFRADNPMP